MKFLFAEFGISALPHFVPPCYIPPIVNPMSAAAIVIECMTCCEKFNKSSRTKVQCPYCPWATCRQCTKHYLSADDFAAPKCPDCKAGWSEEFLETALTKTFMLKEYKECRERVLYEVEKARLPETQEDAQRYKAAKEIVDPVNAATKAIRERYESHPDKIAFDAAVGGMKETECYSEEYFTAYDAYKRMKREMQLEINGIEPDTIHTIRHQVNLYGRMTEFAKATSTKSVWTFRMKCPLDSCEGFVGMNWVCGLCSTKFCSDCHEKVAAETKVGDAVHVCNPDTVATVKTIHSEAKPCPKCATMISKIDGCDQMWCTQCKTAFSWRTGNVEDRIHNPHYYEWLRRSGNQAELDRRAAADRGGEVAVCQDWRQMINDVTRLYWTNKDMRTDEMKMILGSIRLLEHINGSEIEQYSSYRRDVDDKKRVLRVRRLVHEITDEDWRNSLQRMEKQNNKDRRVVQILELFRNTGAEILYQICADRTIATKMNAIIDQVRQLSEYCLNELEKLGKRYNNKMPKWDFMSFVVA